MEIGTEQESASAPSGAQLGRTIRTLRKARALTLVQLAARCDLTHSFLSQLERGQVRPSMASLERIAAALGSSPLELMAAAHDAASGRPEPEVAVIPAGPGSRRTPAGTAARMLLHGNAPFHVLEFDYRDTEPGEYHTHPEAEFLYILRGEALVDLAGHPEHRLGAGDALFTPGSTPHRWRATSAKGFRMLVVKQAGALGDSGSDRHTGHDGRTDL